MTITREDLNPCTVRLSVQPDSEQVKQSFDKAFRQLAKKIKLPGFRPGTAPKAMLEGVIPREDLIEEAAQQLVRATLQPAIEQEGLQPDQTTRPSVEMRAIDQGANTAEYSVKVPLPPKVELGTYDGLKAEREPVTVTDDEVEAQIEEMRTRRGSRETVTDRGVQPGDVAVVSVKLGEDEPRNFMVIAGKSFSTLDAAIEGMKPEEIKSVDLEFPADFQDKDWAGRAGHATITLNSLSGVKLPELDDQFAQSLQTENVDDLRERVRIGLKNAREMMQFEVTTDKLLNDLLEVSDVQVSDNMWETLADRRLRETAQEQAQAGKSLEQYAREQGMSVEEYIQAWRDRAQHEIRRALVIQQVFTREQMQLTNDDLNRELIYMAGEYGQEPAEMLKTLQENQALDELQFRSIQRKVRQFLLDRATSGPVSVPAPEGNPAPVESPAE